jgi:hypothetical protein
MSKINIKPMSDKPERFGFIIAIVTAVITATALGIAVLTPPISGPFCPGPCIDYPYTDIIDRFPRDYIWMFPAMVSMLLYVGLMAAIHQTAGNPKSVFSLFGLALAVMASSILVLDYFIQVSVIQPSLLHGETDGISLITQYNPHGVFIAMEELGYLLMSLSFLLMAPVFKRSTKLERSLRWIFAGSFAINILAFTVLLLYYGTDREYLFEVVVITIDWMVLILSGILLAIWFKKAASNLSVISQN